MRPPRFRRVPFVRDGVLDRGRASTPRITASHMLPSTGTEDLGLCDINLSWLNSPPRTITVYASSAPSPMRTQHSLPGGPLRPYPCGTCPRWNSPASPGAPAPTTSSNAHLGTVVAVMTSRRRCRPTCRSPVVAQRPPGIHLRALVPALLAPELRTQVLDEGITRKPLAQLGCGNLGETDTASPTRRSTTRAM